MSRVRIALVIGLAITLVGVLVGVLLVWRYAPEMLPGFVAQALPATVSTMGAGTHADASPNLIPAGFGAASANANGRLADNPANLSPNNFGDEARLTAKVNAVAYNGGDLYDASSLVDCDACEWIYREKDDCCTSECNLEKDVVIGKPSPYQCGVQGAAPGSKMYNCGPQMCQRGEMKGCTVDNLRRLKSTSSKNQPACSGYKPVSKVGADVKTCSVWDDSKKKCMDKDW